MKKNKCTQCDFKETCRSDNKHFVCEDHCKYFETVDVCENCGDNTKCLYEWKGYSGYGTKDFDHCPYCTEQHKSLEFSMKSGALDVAAFIGIGDNDKHELVFSTEQGIFCMVIDHCPKCGRKLGEIKEEHHE